MLNTVLFGIAMGVSIFGVVLGNERRNNLLILISLMAVVLLVLLLIFFFLSDFGF